jgi:hypothetical protein
MAASFPDSVKNFSAVVNGVTKLVATLFNAVYDEVTAIENAYQSPLGAWVDKSGGYGAQQAATAGFVVVRGGSAANALNIAGYTDSNADPTTNVASMYLATAETVAVNQAFMFPVRKGDYWKVVVTAGSLSSIYWVPLGG